MRSPGDTVEEMNVTNSFIVCKVGEREMPKTKIEMLESEIKVFDDEGYQNE